MFDGSHALALSFPIHLVDHVVPAKHRIHVKRPRLPPSSPLLLWREDSDKVPTGSHRPTELASSAATPFLDSPVSIGVLGGAPAAATLRFVNNLVQSFGDESLPFVVCADPAIGRSLADRERSPAALESLRRGRVFLERAGARCIAMPCHAAHAWHLEIAEGCAVPFLDAGECVAEELKAAKLRPAEIWSNVRVGVLALDATSLVARFYQEKLEKRGFEVVFPDKETMEHMVIPAMEAFERKDMEGARNLVRISIHVLLVRAVSSIVLASDSMQGLLPEDDPLLRMCIDPMDALVRATLLWALSVSKN
ncbi:uncharacterized protein LOC122034884 [Zingiber officinale]|uniref:Aspartate racemase n=1 Tax=Zingiber officinale TaxID=94328 RepID=A0A8J5I759_ZINOF|nr:uncharacterized protein LOC122034884 [Zingiber officinale]KAG6537519.1 hypothetical protein ZIOFF_002613 [Zingiber officinale]